jgi:hypothetical protein
MDPEDSIAKPYKVIPILFDKEIYKITSRSSNVR